MSAREFRISEVGVTSNGTIVVADASEAWTRLMVFAPDGSPGEPDAELELPFETHSIVPLTATEVLCISLRGEVAKVGASVELRNEMPPRHGNDNLVVSAARLHSRVYIATMSGELLERNRDGDAWVPVCQPLPRSCHVWKLVALGAGLFAVGSHVWQRDGRVWKQTSAPAGRNYRSLTLHEGELVTMCEKSIVHATVGAAEWLEDQLDVRTELRDVCSFRGVLYAAVDGHVLTFSEGELRLDDQSPMCEQLVTNGELLVAASPDSVHVRHADRWGRVW